MSKIIHAADLFCGAGGTTTGALLAAEAMGKKLQLLAVNHWERAIETHAANHPWADHICSGLEDLKPEKAVPGGKLDLLIAAPECTHHSIARGGKPRNDQSRASAWHVLHWCQELYVREVLIENVPEFLKWGPLGANGKPLKSKQGETFKAFITAMESLGYRVEWRMLTCADYGDATTRRRFFLRARRGNRKINWPVASHAKAPGEDLFGRVAPWVPAREVIDWKFPSKSIFARKKPLAKNTIRRIEAGIKKFWGKWAEPFLVVLNGGGCLDRGRPIDLPLPTQVNSNHIGLVQPFLTQSEHDMRVHSIDNPFKTITANSRSFGVVEPFLCQLNGWPSQMMGKSLDNPLPAQTTGNHFGVVEPFLVPFFGERLTQDPRTHGISDPLATVTSHGAGGLVEPFLVRYNGDHAGKRDSADRVHPTKEPLPTQDCSNRYAVCEPFLVKFYGSGISKSVDGPLDAVTTKPRFGLVKGDVCALDILFRMLQPHELAAAHSFPKGYSFKGTKGDQVKQIGNSVPVETSKALVGSAISA